MMDTTSRMEPRPPTNGGQFPSSFPETFKDFFSMTNEDEDHVEAITSILEDKVIPRYNTRERNRSGSTKSSHSAFFNSNAPTSYNFGRSSSFRVHRSTSGSLPSNSLTSDYCKHIKYCCLHQNFNSARDVILGESDKVVGNSNSQINDFTRCDDQQITDNSRGRTGGASSSNLGPRYNLNEYTNYSNYSDDEKSNKFSSKFVREPIDTSQSQVQNFDTSTSNFNNEIYEESSSINPISGTFKLYRPSGGNSSNYNNAITNSNITSNILLDPSESELTAPTLLPAIPNLNRATNIQDIARHPKSPIFARRRSSLSLARTIPNFPISQMATTTTHSDVHRYMKTSDEQQPQSTPWGHQILSESSGHNNNNNSREKYNRSKSPNIVSRKTIENSNPTSSTSIAIKEKQRMRTASMPAENRKPLLKDTRRSAIHCADVDIEYYRLRSFSITSHGICNLGDSMRSRRSRSINSVTSTGTSNSGRDRNNSTGSQIADIKEVDSSKGNNEDDKPGPYKIAMLGDSGVGKTALTYQFTTSEYICAYDLSLDDDYGQKTVSVMLEGQETDLEIIDHPSCEMSVEAFCSTYNIDLFVVVYSIVDRKTLRFAEKILIYLKEHEMMLTRGVILVGNKIDMERQREVSTQTARKLAKEIGCKFIETSSGLNHNVDELLVGIVAQVKLNSQRISNLTEKQRSSICSSLQQKYKRSADHMRRANQRKTNMNKLLDTPPPTNMKSSDNKNKENIQNVDGDNPDEESDDELSSEDEGGGDVYEKDKIERCLKQHRQLANSPKSSSITNLQRLLNYRRYGSAGFNQYFSNTSGNNNNNNNNDSNLSSSSCSTPISVRNTLLTNPNNKRQSYESCQQPQTPKKTASSGPSSTDDSNDKCISKLSNRTKLFLTSFLKFKKSIRVKRRNSSSCSDLFVI